MAKHSKELKMAQRDATQHRQTELKEVLDDSLLPDAEEIAKLKTHDPDIMNWLKERVAIEQEFRHNYAFKRNDSIEGMHKREHGTVRIGLLIYLICFLGCIIPSYLLLSNGHSVGGSIFGGAAVAVGLGVLVGRAGKTSNKNTIDTHK
jgi:hypothetical protein